MKNDIYTDIGRRIRKKRTEAGLTQTALCGDKITRNMLSRIENGAAHPSLDTLLYLSNRLGVPAAYFLCMNESEEAQYDKAVVISEMRSFIKDGRYDRAAAVCTDKTDDEVLFAKALSEGRCAVSMLKRMQITDALKHIEFAFEAAQSTVYLQDELILELRLLKSLCDSASDGTLPEPSLIAAAPSVIIDPITHIYLLLLSLYEHTGNAPSGGDILPEGSVYREHVEAKELEKMGQYDKALELLLHVTERSDNALTAISAMKDSELCYYKTGQYKEAYEISKKREALLSERI